MTNFHCNLGSIEKKINVLTEKSCALCNVLFYIFVIDISYVFIHLIIQILKKTRNMEF